MSASAGRAEVGFVDYDAGAADYHGYAVDPGSDYAGAALDDAVPGFDPVAVDAARGL